MHSEEHPSDADISRYCLGDRTHVRRIEEHLVYCSDCALKVAEIVRAQVEAERNQRTDTPV